MTIGTLSLDPRRVLAAYTECYRGRYILTVKYMASDGTVELDDAYFEEDEAKAALAKLDAACYKGPLADAVSDKAIDDEDDDDCDIGFLRG